MLYMIAQNDPSSNFKALDRDKNIYLLIINYNDD
jgi:hypothetical protein